MREVRDLGTRGEAPAPDAARLDRLIDDLGASSGWHEDTTTHATALLARLPRTAATQVQRDRLTLIGVQHLVGDRGPTETARLVMEVRTRALARGDRALHARAEQAMAGLFLLTGDFSVALQHAVTAVALDDDAFEPVLRCTLRIVLADALTMCGSLADARPHFRRALEQARSLGSPWQGIRLLNNWAYGELVAGELVAAASLVGQMRSMSAEHGARLPHAETGTVAEVLHALGRSQEAVAMLLERLREDSAPVTSNVVTCWLALAWIRLDLGDLDAAQAAVDTVQRRASAGNLHALHAESLGARAGLLAARGDHAGAYETHVRFHEETLALGSSADEARARTLHAMLEAEVARRESARYREMSYRDALTRLLNRRHVEEDLDRRLAATGAAPPLSVAMVDLDRFKRVNDTFSHEAGDAVLVRLARLLEGAAAAPGAYAARLGGEEFLLVLPGADLSAARAVAEDLRRRIAATDWSDVAPGLAVTASVGLASAPRPPHPATGRAALLREADRHLHAAKTGGRDRVEPAPRAQGGAAG